ncbi:MAG: hypothetical protein GWN71_33445, partial [Gammaproteobacteria bacterium]|nr:hypothetical protein [Gammaproteobacteria bacterium]
MREANRAIRRAAREDPDKAGMGTTATALAIGDDGYRIAHVGDSRAYLIREEALRRVTVDHTW